MIPLAIRNAIITELSNNWSSTDIAWPNKDYTPSPDIPYIKFYIKMGGSYIGELNDGIGLRTGVLIIHLFEPLNEGTITTTTYAGNLEDIFRRKDLSGVLFNEPSTNEIGVNGVFYQTNISIPFNCFIGE